MIFFILVLNKNELYFGLFLSFVFLFPFSVKECKAMYHLKFAQKEITLV